MFIWVCGLVHILRHLGLSFQKRGISASSPSSYSTGTRHEPGFVLDFYKDASRVFTALSAGLHEGCRTYMRDFRECMSDSL